MSTELRTARLSIIALLIVLSGGCAQNAIPVSSLEARVRRILELPTYEHIYRDVVYFDEERSYVVFKTRKAVLFSVDISVQAGLDLTKGFEIKRRGFSRAIAVVPPAEILLIDADESSIQEYFVEERFDAISRLDYYDEIDRSKEKIREDAINRGILERAQERAYRLIRGVLTSAGYERVDIIQAASE